MQEEAGMQARMYFFSIFKWGRQHTGRYDRRMHGSRDVDASLLLESSKSEAHSNRPFLFETKVLLNEINISYTESANSNMPKNIF